MKKNKISFDTSFWAGYTIENPFKAIDAFFTYAHLDYYKQHLSEAVMYCYKTKVYKQDNPSDIFILYSVFSSFIKICYCLQKKNKKLELTASSPSEALSNLSSLTKEQYENPFIAFQKAFEVKTLEEFQLFLYLMVEFSLSPHSADPDQDLITPYIHLMKMLDAAELIKERGVEKIKKKKSIV